MNRKRGRPRGKVFPQPDNVFKGIWTAEHGQIGASAAMQIVVLCPYQEIRRIEKLPAEKRSVWDKQALELRRRYLKKWNSEIGRIVGEKIAAGDYPFFQELATAIESLKNKNDVPYRAGTAATADIAPDLPRHAWREECGRHHRNP
jgi:hypothetical protein